LLDSLRERVFVDGDVDWTNEMLCLVCGIERTTNTFENTTMTSGILPIAGDWTNFNGIPLDAEVYRLKDSRSHTDADKEGLTLELSGGAVPLSKKGKKQKAIIEFLCDLNTDGTDTDLEDPSDSDDKETENLTKRDEEKKEKESPMKFISYKDEKVGKDDQDWGVLRISWSTKYACENAINEPSPNKGSSWGFFTWFIIMYVLAPTPPLLKHF
jgi:hypothetical protein